jgi:membrane-associated phospholipid phosphatase
LCILSLLMFYSRIASGVHYPWDIIVGLILWLLFGFCFYKLQSLPKAKKAFETTNSKIIRILSYIKL